MKTKGKNFCRAANSLHAYTHFFFSTCVLARIWLWKDAYSERKSAAVIFMF